MSSMSIVKTFDEHSKAFIRSVVGLILLSIILIIVVPMIRQSQKATMLEITVAPTSAIIEISGKEYRNGTYAIEPGEYEVKISRDGFDSKEQHLTIKAHELTTFRTFLIHRTEGLKYYERSAADLAALRLNVSDAEVNAFLADYDERLKIKDILPINASYNLKDTNPSFGNYMILIKIDDGSTNPKCQLAFCLVVTGDERNEARVRERLAAYGFNYADYEIIYE